MTKKERRRGRQGEGAVTMTELAMHMPKAYFRRRGRELRRRRVGEQPEGVTGVLLGAEYCLIRRLELHTFHWCARCLRDRMRSADGARDCLKAAMANQEILLLPPHIPASSLSNQLPSPLPPPPRPQCRCWRPPPCPTRLFAVLAAAIPDQLALQII